MENKKILNLLDDANDSKFVIRKWSIIDENLKANYGVRNKITYNTVVLKSNLCDYKDAYILVTGDITIIGDNRHEVAFKKGAPFIKCIRKMMEL